MALIYYVRSWSSTSTLRAYLYDGSGRHVRRGGAAQLLHRLTEEIAAVDDKVLAASGRFATVKVILML